MSNNEALAPLFAQLGIEPSASLEEVNSAYKARARLYIAAGNPIAELQHAHRVLADSSLRDAYRTPGPAQPLALGVTEFGKGPNDSSGHEVADATGRPAYGYAGFQGCRPTMDDALLLGVPCVSGASMFGVFDGHGGRRAADFLLSALPEVVNKLPLSEGLSLHLPDAACKAYAQLDREILERQQTEGWNDGSTALLALVSKNRIQVLQVRQVCAHSRLLAPHPAVASRSAIARLSCVERSE